MEFNNQFSKHIVSQIDMYEQYCIVRDFCAMLLMGGEL